MSENPAADGSFRAFISPGLHDTLTTTGGRFRLVVVAVILGVVVAVAAHVYGRKLATGDIQERDNTIQQLRSEGQKREVDLVDRSAQLAALQAKLSSVQAALDAITPSENTYNVRPNSSITIADGRLTIGLVGPPTNEGVTINVNGKQQPLAVGDIVHVAPDAETKCQVAVQSFDMFKVVLAASCVMAMPQ